MHQFSALREREEIRVAHLVDLSLFNLFCNEPRREFLTTDRTKKIFNVAVVVGGTTDPELSFNKEEKGLNDIYMSWFIYIIGYYA